MLHWDLNRLLKITLWVEPWGTPFLHSFRVCDGSLLLHWWDASEISLFLGFIFWQTRFATLLILCALFYYHIYQSYLPELQSDMYVPSQAKIAVILSFSPPSWSQGCFRKPHIQPLAHTYTPMCCYRVQCLDQGHFNTRTVIAGIQAAGCWALQTELVKPFHNSMS